MFNKLLSNLPFNPSLITQVAFYGQRLKKEGSVRRLGVLFVALALTLQLFAIMAPPKPTLARVGNDMIPGGFGSLATAVSHCRADRYSFGTILRKFRGATCDNLAAGSVRTIKSTDYNRQLYSMGRIAYGKPNEVPVTIEGAGTFYMRSLWGWDTGGASTYKVIFAHNVFGIPVIVMFSCGNIVMIGKPNPPPPPKPPPPPEVPPCTPETCLKLSKSARNSTRNILDANNTTAKPKDVINYTLTVKNTGKSIVKGFVIEENLTDVLEYAELVDIHGGTKYSQNIIRWPAVDINPGETITKFITVKVKSVIPNTPSPESNPGAYDCVMNNVYGNAINIKVTCGTVKKTEKVVKTLPNTGPGTTMVAGFGITAFAGYFFARNRLLTKELDEIKKEYSSSGGN
ncbi:hypothetical protein A3J32_02260 [Candidatus Saccharibacteria bacterium RIFCSPLOWO2_02_FULL_46_7]|nr:MAG: hypothetical protein A3J32_02260 [Candidatus Saccharibacteria bacterium RIFCSPLOWO2_02_FULL_46_7]